MADELLNALAGDEVLQTNSLATVTRSWILIKNPDAHKRMVLSIDSLSAVRRVRTTYPGLLVIACALFLISAAAAYSRDNSGAGIPVGILGLIFIVFYLASRRGAVCFFVGSEEFSTINGSLTDAKNTAAAISEAQALAAKHVA